MQYKIFLEDGDLHLDKDKANLSFGETGKGDWKQVDLKKTIEFLVIQNFKAKDGKRSGCII